MIEEFKDLPPLERMRAENEYMRLKLMAERGASIHLSDAGGPAETYEHNRFLRSVLAFEERSAGSRMQPLGKVHPLKDKFCQPDDVPGNMMEQAWANMDAWLMKVGVIVVAKSPRVQPADLYRFVYEELVELPILDPPPAGMLLCFFYDDFHPDPEHEACCFAVHTGIVPVLTGTKFPPRHAFCEELFELSGKPCSSAAEFEQRVRNFRDLFDLITPRTLRACVADVRETEAAFKGDLEAIADTGAETMTLQTNWQVKLLRQHPDDPWMIRAINFDEWMI